MNYVLVAIIQFYIVISHGQNHVVPPWFHTIWMRDGVYYSSMKGKSHYKYAPKILSIHDVFVPPPHVYSKSFEQVHVNLELMRAYLNTMFVDVYN